MPPITATAMITMNKQTHTNISAPPINKTFFIPPLLEAWQ
jgi:hypothetical protein